jgi:hypothetical protein
MIRATAGRKHGVQHGQTQAARSRKRQPQYAGSKPGAIVEDPRNEFSDDEWNDMVANAAYFRAEARGFDEGSADEDWYEAEAELRERFSAVQGHVESVSSSGGDSTNIETTGE